MQRIVDDGSPSQLCDWKCTYLKLGTEYKFSSETFQVKKTMNCTVTNVIYTLTCLGCNEYYIGETGDSLRHRMTVHRQQIRDPTTRMLGVSKHIAECAKDIKPNFTVFPFYKVFSPSESARKFKEQYFINKFKPVLNTISLRWARARTQWNVIIILWRN